MYRVKEFFHDLQDRQETKAGPIFHAYHPGDEYPRAGYKPSAERIAELATSANARGFALIEYIGADGKPVDLVAETAADPGPEAQMEGPKAPAEKKPRRRTAKKAQ